MLKWKYIRPVVILHSGNKLMWFQTPTCTLETFKILMFTLVYSVHSMKQNSIMMNFFYIFTSDIYMIHSLMILSRGGGGGGHSRVLVVRVRGRAALTTFFRPRFPFSRYYAFIIETPLRRPPLRSISVPMPIKIVEWSRAIAHPAHRAWKPLKTPHCTVALPI